MKNKFLKIFYFIIVFIILFGCSQVHATLEPYTRNPSYWGGEDNSKLTDSEFLKIMYNNRYSNTNNAFVNESWHKAPSEWGNNCIFTRWTPEYMVFINKYIKNTNIDDFTKDIGSVKSEMRYFLKYFEKFISDPNIQNGFLKALENAKKNENEKYDTDGSDGFTQDEDSSVYFSYIAKNAVDFCKDVRYSIQKINIAIGTTYTASDGKSVNYKDDINTKKNYTKAQIERYIEKYGESGLESVKTDKTCVDKWEKTLGKKVDKYNDEEVTKYIEEKTGKKVTELQKDAKEVEKKVENKNTKGYAGFEQGQLYHLPERVAKNDSNSTNLDQIIDGADKFMNSATKNEIESDAIQNLSNTIYNILLVVGIIIAIIIGAVIGIMFITGSVEQKADVKKLLIPYIVGCVVVFGSFAIWKIAVTMFSGM